MGVYIYTIKDRLSGEVLYAGRKAAAARYLGCSENYLYKLALRKYRTGDKSPYGRMEISRQCQEWVRCVDCGAEIPGANSSRVRCDACNKARKRERDEKRRKKKSLQEELQKGCIGCFYFRGSIYTNRCCNYIFIEGHSRGCPPGEGCTKRKEGEET